MEQYSNPTQDQDPQSDPYVGALANADSGSVKAMTDSLYREAPASSLVSRTPGQRKSQSAVRSMYDWFNTHTKGYLDPVMRGAVSGYNELGKSIAGGMAYVGSKLGADETGEHMQELRRIQRDGMVTAHIANAALGEDTNTGLHAFVRDAAQFATVNEVLGGQEAFGATSKAAKWAIHAARGAAADFTGFDPRKERLSNLLEDAPLGIGMVARQIAENPDDSEATARFKQMMEGVALSSTVDAALHGLKSFGGRVKDLAGAVRSGSKEAAPAAEAAVASTPKAPEPFTVEPTPMGQFRVVAKDPEVAAAMQEHIEHTADFDTPEKAETVAASLNYAHTNAQRPKMEVTPEQATHLQTLAKWIHETGKYEDFQNGTVDINGNPQTGLGDHNFAYDLEPEQVGHLISSMSAIFRKEIDAARIPEGLQLDPKGGRSISHAETLARAANEFNGVTPTQARSRFHDIADAVDEAPAAIVAAKVLRQNIAQSAEQLAHAMDANPENTVAHGEFVKAANSLLQTFVAEKRLLSGSGRALNAGQIRIGANGAAVDAEALGRSLKNREVDPLDVLHFELLDEPVSDTAVHELDAAHEAPTPDSATPSVTPDETLPAEPGATPAEKPAKPKKAAGAKAPKAPTDKPNPGPNTYTVADEALDKIDKGLKAIDDAELKRQSQDVPTEAQASAKSQKSDQQVLGAVRKNKSLMENARNQLGITEEDAKLAKERMRAANNIVAEARAKGTPNPIEGLSHDELNDVASIDAERIKRLADAQRKEPLTDPRPPEPKAEGDAAAKEPKKNVGTNTFTVADEASHRIAEAEKRIDEELKKNAAMSPEQAAERQDKMAARQIPKHDPERVNAAVDFMGGTPEDAKLAKDRLLAIRQTIQEKRASAGLNTVDWSRYSDVELDDLAMMHGERIMKLAQEQRDNPMVPRRERTVYLTARQARAMARQMTYVPRNPKEQEQVLKAILGMGRKATEATADAAPSTWDKIVSYRRWSMLSAPTTPEVNFFSAVSTALYRPVEGMLAGVAKRDPETARRYADLMTGTLKSFHDAMQQAKVSWETGGSVLTARDTSVPQVGPSNATGFVQRVLKFAGVPERLMTAGDEFAQQIAYRGHVYAQSLAHSRSAGITDAAEIAGRASDDISRAFDAAGQGQNPSAVAYAQDVTLRRELEYGVGKWIEQGARDVPAIRMLFPFTRIPANVARFTMDRAPLGMNLFTQRNITDLAAGGSQRDEAIGRTVAGNMIWSMAALMHHGGMMTGGGPKDPELRREWLNVYQPYSIKLPGTDQWVSYRRFEPLSTPLGIVSDFMEMAGEMQTDGDVTKAVDGFAAGVASNLMSKTYLKSMSDFFYAMGSGKATATDAMIDGMAGSFVPNIVQKANPDDQLRATRDFVDRLQSRIPGFSEGLEPRRNIYGEKVLKPGNQFQRMFNPFTVREDKADAVDIELLRLGEGMSMPVPRKYGVDLQDRSLGVKNQSPYDRWMELMSQPLDGEPALRDKLREFVQSDEYKQLTDNSEGFKGSRSLAVEKIVRSYRSAAFAKMVEENPKLLDAIRANAMHKAAALSDDPDVTEALTHTSDSQVRGHAAEAQAFMGTP